MHMWGGGEWVISILAQVTSHLRSGGPCQAPPMPPSLPGLLARTSLL